MEKCFSLMYYIPGLTDTGLEQMPRGEREWYFNRLVQQKKQEAEARRRAQKKG